MTVNALIVTQIGLDGAVDAANGGITLRLSTFKVGSGFGYTPTKTDTGLHGATLYTDNITSFSTASDGSLIVNCTMAVTAGPFDFGEVGIYTDDNRLFALLALPALEHKYTSLGSTVASTFTFQCYLRLGQVGGIIEIVAGGGGGGSGGTSNFVYTMNSGQPTALWGTNNGGVDSFVWNPSNFNVNTAKGIQSAVTGFYNAEGHTWHRADGTTVLATMDTAGTFLANNLGLISDMRHKTNVEVISDLQALEIAMGIPGITYELYTDPGVRRLGTSAQDLLKLAPEGVVVGQDEQQTLAVLYGQVALAVLPGAIRAVRSEFTEVITELKDTISDLKDQIEELKRGPLKF